MKIKSPVSKVVVISLLALGSLSAFGSQIFCAKGNPEGAQTGFFKIGDELSCPNFSVRCVDHAKCPQINLPNCPADSTFQSVINGFSEIENGTLACPLRSGGCVNLSKCPAIAPINCEHGNVEAIVVGYRKIDDQYSCPIVQMACVDIRQCPVY